MKKEKENTPPAVSTPPAVDNKAKELDFEKKLLACFHDRQDTFPQKIDLRTSFLLQNRCWINFLNAREETKKPENSNSVHYVWRNITTNEIDHETILDLTKMTKALQDWQAGNRIFTNVEPNHICETSHWKYNCEKDLIIAVGDWMFENLKAISRDTAKCLFDIPSFGLKEATALLKKATMIIAPDQICYDYDYYDNSDETYIPTLARYVHKFCMYIARLIEIKKNGYKQWTKEKFFKVGVCPYQRRKEPECGKVFVGWQREQDACKEHVKLWKVLKCRRKIRERQQEKNS
jgi:hypothetical protein